MKHEEAVRSTLAERYVLGELSGEDREEFEEHYFSCPACAQTMRDFAKLEANMKAVFAEPTRASEDSESIGSRSSKGWLTWLSRNPAYGLAAACVLALVIGGIGFQAGVKGARESVPQAVTAIMLTPDTRGDIAVVNLKTSAGYFLLESDLPGVVAPVEWKLRESGSAKIILQGVADQPQAGAPLNLLLRASFFQTVEYRLNVRQTGNALNKWDFRFKVKR